MSCVKGGKLEGGDVSFVEFFLFGNGEMGGWRGGFVEEGDGGMDGWME